MKKTAGLGMLTCLALILSYIEALIPIMPAVPGVKLGLANLIILLVLYLYSAPDALLVNLSRVFLAAFLFGNGASLLYSISGALCSLFVMTIAKKSRIFTAAGVSIAGGAAHNISQLITAAFLTGSFSVFYYLPWLILSGCVTGLVNGLLVGWIQKRTPFHLIKDQDVRKTEE